ncbi:MAG: hypothetical protein MJ215_07505 [Spirochaetia bacterium]|nr:hypothetical protein [Spirochaetia bacterium]
MVFDPDELEKGNCVLTLYAQWFGTGIEDKVDGMVKSDVVIKNTGTVREYIRATITANWYDAEGNIVAPWSVDSTGKCSQGEFTGLTGTGWKLGADGYYYYTYPVDGAEELKKVSGNALFTQYKYEDTEIPVVGAHLEMQIMVQSVIWDKDKAEVTEAWGSTAAGYLNATKN